MVFARLANHVITLMFWTSDAEGFVTPEGTAYLDFLPTLRATSLPCADPTFFVSVIGVRMSACFSQP
jgi:hypothetical protein